MIRPAVAVLIVLSVVAGAASLGGVAAAGSTPTAAPTAANNSTATATATPTPTEGNSTPTASPTESPTPRPTPSPTPTPSESDGGSRYTISELREPGRQLDNAPSSVRLDRDAGVLMWLQYVPAGSLTSGYSRDAARFTTRSTVVKQNRVWLRSNLVNVPDSAKNMTATVVAYREGTDENGTAVAQNVTVLEQQVSMSPGFSRSKIRLPEVDGSAKNVVIWLKTSEGDRIATFHFKHRSAATTQEIPLPESAGMGALVGWGFLNIGTPILVGSVAGMLIGFGAIKRARDGPGVTGMAWLFVAMPFATLLLAMLYFNLVELFVSTPLLLAFPAMGLVTVVTILYSPGATVDKGLLLRPSVTETTAPSGDEGRDFSKARDEVIRLVDTPNGGKAIIKDGWLAFLARIYGGLAEIENWDEAQTLTQLPNSTHDWLHIVSPESGEVHEDELYGYERPGLTASLPESWSGIAWRLMLTISAGVIGWGLYPGQSVWLGLITAAGVAVALSLDGTAGWAYIPWGSRHHRSAYATAQLLAEEMDAADSAAESEKKRMKQEARIERKAREKMSEYEGAYLSAMLGTDDVGSVVEDTPDTASTDEILAAWDAGNIDAERATEMLAQRKNGEGKPEPGGDG